MNTQRRRFSLVASTMLAGAIMLGGCGGGGGGDTSTTVSTASVAISGKAVDELILNGVVEVHNGSAAGAVIGSGRTDSSNGTYTIDLNGYEGVAVVKVTCDATSRLYDPDTNTTESCPTQTQLYSAADVSGDVDQTVNVSPATHVMYMMATEGDPNQEVDGQKLEEARVAAAQIFGTDPITSDPVEGIYADVIKAFHEAAAAAGLSIQEIVEDIAEDAADGTLGDDSNATYTLARYMLQNRVITSFVVAAENNETFDPETADEVGTIDDVQAAKDFFQNLRTLGYDLFKDGGLFDTEAKGMESVVENVTLNGDLAGLVVGNLLAAAGFGTDNDLTEVSATLVALADSTREANLTRADLNATLWNYTITDTNTVTGETTLAGSGTITLPAVDPETFDWSNFDSLTAAFDGTIPATKLYEANQAQQTLQANATLTKTTDGAQLEVGDINLSTADGTMIGIQGFIAEVGYDYNASNPDPLQLNYVKLNEITLNGALDSNYTASATLKVDYTVNESLAANGGFETGNSGYIPDNMILDGVIKNVQTETELNGTLEINIMNAADINLSDLDNVVDKPHLLLYINGVLKRAGFDDMSLNLEVEYNPDTSTTNSSLAYVYGPMTVNAVSSIDDNGDGNVTVTSGNGLSITVVLDNGDINYNETTPLTKDNKEVGRLDDETGIPRIKYIDGTFESLP